MMVCGVPCEAAPAVQQQVDELVVYVQGDFEVPLEERQSETQVCFDCHVPNEHTSYAEVIERTKEYPVDDEKINPHDPHAGLEERQLECLCCHQMHEESPLINGCYSCHHAGTFENCSTCHGE
jgi:hypothetical protein